MKDEELQRYHDIHTKRHVTSAGRTAAPCAHCAQSQARRRVEAVELFAPVAWVISAVLSEHAQDSGPRERRTARSQQTSRSRFRVADVT